MESKIKLNLNQEFEELNINEALQRAEITYTMPIPREEMCIGINDGVNKQSIGSYGDFSATVGKAKARKSFALSMIMGAAVKAGYYDLLEANTFNRNNLLFDTEQGKKYVYWYNRRVINICGSNKQPDNFKTFMLRPFGPMERIQMIEHVLSKTPNLGLVVIDGVRDLVTSINNEDEASFLVNRIMYWTEKYNCHINCVLHINPIGEIKLRGHLGTEVTNKAESVIMVEKSKHNDGYSIVSPFETRGGDFKPFGFYIDNKIPIIDREYFTTKFVGEF